MFMTAQQLQNVEMRRSLTFSFRGEPASFTRLQQLRRGAKAPPAEQANAADESSPLVRLQKDDQPLRAQLRYWGVDEFTKDLDLAHRDLDPAKVPALATFLAASRNLVTVDVRGNGRLTIRDGREIGAALLDNFHHCPQPKFLDASKSEGKGKGGNQNHRAPFARPVSAKPFKPRHRDGTAIVGNESVDVADAEAVEGRVEDVARAMTRLRQAMAEPPGSPHGSALALGACLARCFALDLMDDNPDVAEGCKRYVALLEAVGTRFQPLPELSRMALHSTRKSLKVLR